MDTITQKEKSYLRDLTKRYLEYAHKPVMAERERLWRLHNKLQGERPMVVMENGSYIWELMPEMQCETKEARGIEWNLLSAIVNEDLICDDKVISPYYTVHWAAAIHEFQLDIPTEHAMDSKGRSLGYQFKHPIKDLTNDFHLIKPSRYWHDKPLTMEQKEFAEDVFGDLMPVVVKNGSLTWHFCQSGRIVRMMGLETMMYEMMDNPELIHRLMQMTTDDMLNFTQWLQDEGLLTTNSGNDYVGAGSYGFSDELPTYKGPAKAADLWANLNSQESVGISPEMYHEFMYPYYRQIAEKFGLVYYGCCEPVHTIWRDSVSQYPNLRKVSISAWCDEDYMGEALRGSKVIYSRKPSPNFLGAYEQFDEEAFTEHIQKTVDAAKGCALEFIFRDTYTVFNDRMRPGRAAQIVRRLSEK